jgi:hypothetical protein
VGFAQKKAFLTTQLSDWANQKPKDPAAETSGAQRQLDASYKGGAIYFNWGATVGRLKDGKVDDDESKNSLRTDNLSFNGNEMRIPGKAGSAVAYYPGNFDNYLNRFVTVPQLYNVANTDTYIDGSRVFNVEDNFQKNSKTLMPTVVEFDFSGILGGAEVATIKPKTFNNNFEIVYQYKISPTSVEYNGKSTGKIPVTTVDASPWVQDTKNPKKWYNLLYLDWDNVTFDKNLPNRIPSFNNTGYILADTFGSLHIRYFFTVTASVTTLKGGTAEVTSKEFSSVIPFGFTQALYGGGANSRIIHKLSQSATTVKSGGGPSSTRR